MIASITTTETVPWGVADNMVAYLMEPVDVLADHADNPLLEAEPERVVDLIEAYASRRWPQGKVAGDED